MDVLRAAIARLAPDDVELTGPVDALLEKPVHAQTPPRP